MKSTAHSASRVLFVASLILAAGAADLLRGAESENLEFFEKKIRPILVEKCYACHAAGSKSLKGGLRVDSRDALLRGGDSGPALVPGNAGESLLIKAIEHAPDFYEMPPDGKLPAAVIADFRKWVELGAPDPRLEIEAPAPRNSGRKSPSVEEGKQFWSFQPLHVAAPPAVSQPAWPQVPADAFLQAKLDAQQLVPEERANREALLRRLYLDLIGLPPELTVIDGFLAIPEEELDRAYERIVDELIGSPQFGERWGRHWLDLFRFAESSGGGRTLLFPDAWRFRDYVLEAVNADRPLRQMIVELLAGDLLPAQDVAVRRRNLIATAFLALGPTNYERQDKDVLEMDVIDEQLETIGRAFLGMTLGCARCHDHKFDPIPTADYYALAGILRSTRTLIHENVSKWVESPLPAPPDQESQIVAREEQIAALTKQLQQAKQAAKAGPAPATPVKSRIVPVAELPGIVIDDAAAAKVGKWIDSTYFKHYVGTGYTHDENKDKGAKTLTFVPQFTQGGRYEVRFAYAPGDNRATNVPVTVFHADGENTIMVNERLVPPIEGLFVSLGVYRFEPNGQGFVLVATEATDGHVIADAVQFLPAEASRAAASSPATAAAQAKNSSAAAEPDAELTRRIKELETQLKQLNEQGPQRELAMSVREHERIDDCPILIRGNLTTMGKVVPRGFLSVLPVESLEPIGAQQSGRRQFAEWLVHPHNPLTPRVVVNRIWYWLFGGGIVRSTDNFGATGETPSHPELLDYLALQFLNNDWSLKRTVREFVLSEAYRLTTEVEPARRELDRDNRWWSRMNRRRLDVEAMRDLMLFNSGRLDLRLGGPNIKPGTTIEYGYEFTDTRRSIYTPVFRNTLPRWYEAFDFANPNQTVGRRERSTSTTQALFLMNDPFILDQSRLAAERLLADRAINDRERAVRAYRQTLGRFPTEAESDLVVSYVSQVDPAGRAASPTERGARSQAVRDAALARWSHLFQSLYSSVEFRYLP